MIDIHNISELQREGLGEKENENITDYFCSLHFELSIGCHTPTSLG